MAYFWEYFAVYPLECAIIISIVVLVYVGWIKHFWYIHKPSLYTTKMGEWRVRRFVGRIVSFETDDGQRMLTEKYASTEKEGHEIHIKIYIGGQPVRPMILDNKDIWSIRRIPKKLFKKEYTMNKKNVMWLSEENAYRLTDERVNIYLIKPEEFEKALIRKIDNMDLKSSRGSRVSPHLIWSGYWNNHLSIPEDAYEEDEKLSKITPYSYDRKDSGGYSEDYNQPAVDVEFEEINDEEPKDKITEASEE